LGKIVYNEEALTRYLLGELDEEGKEQIEAHYLENREFFDLLLLVEDELIESYVGDRLTEKERYDFEKYFLTSRSRRERVQFAESWKIFLVGLSTDDTDANKPIDRKLFFMPSKVSNPAPWLPWAAILILLAGCTWLTVELVRLRKSLGISEAERVALKEGQDELRQQIEESDRNNQQLSKDLENVRDEADRVARGPDVRPAPPPAGTVSFILSPGILRDLDESKKLNITPSAKWVRLDVRFKQADYKSYTASIRTVDGNEVTRRNQLRSRTAGSTESVIVQLPADRLKKQNYILTLEGVTEAGETEKVGQYPFTVMRK
jgi:hypothetical protein